MMENTLEEKSFGSLTSDIVREELPNGMNVLLKQVYPSKIAGLAVWAKVGSVHETDPIAGISHFVEHMLFKGTTLRSVGQIAQEIQACGGYMNAFTDFECTCYWIILPSKYLPVALDVQADALLHSTFDEQELHKECQVILEELKMNEDRPEAFCFQKLMSLAFQKHPYGRPIIGFENTLLGITRQDLVDYFSRLYKANNIFVAVIGDVSPAGTLKKIKQAFGKVPGGPLNRPERAVEPAQTEFRKMEFAGHIARSHLQMAFHVPHATHEETYILDVVAALLGEGKSSRFHRSLCEKNSWADEASAGVISYQDSGFFFVDVKLDQKNQEKVEWELWEEIEKLKNSPLLEGELKKAKTLLESNYILSQETVEEQGRVLGYCELLEDESFGGKYLRKISETTQDEVQRMARKYLIPQNCSRVFYRNKS